MLAPKDAGPRGGTRTARAWPRPAARRRCSMTADTRGAIDCDLHPALPGCMALLPYLDDHWREEIVSRGLDDLDFALWPRNAPLTARADWRPQAGLAGGSVDLLRAQALEP